MSKQRTQGKAVVAVLLAAATSALNLAGTAGAASAAPLSHVRTIGGAGTDEVRDVAVDGTGNVIVGGSFSGTAKVKGPNEQTLVASGAKDGFVARYDEAGTVLWAAKLGGAADTDEVTAVTTDAAGDVYAIGTTASTTFAYPGGSVPVGGGTDGFVVKFDAATGSVDWVRLVSGVNDQKAYDIGTAYGMVYVVGTTRGLESVTVDSPGGSAGAPSFGLAGKTNGVVSALTTNGLPLWVKVWGDAANDDELRGVSVDPDGAYVGGTFVSSASYGGIALVGSGPEEGVVARVNPNGTVQWAASVADGVDAVAGAGARVYTGGTRLEAHAADTGAFIWSNNLLNGIASIAIGPFDEPFVAGSFGGLKSASMLTGLNRNFTSAGFTDAWVASVEPTSGKPIDIETGGGTGFDYGRGIAVDPAGTAVLGGSFDTSATFQNLDLTGTSWDGYVVRYRMGPAFHGVTPARILDTRIGQGAPKAKVGPGQKIDVLVAGAGGVSTLATAVVVNITAVNATDTSHLRVWPTGQAMPNASTVNFAAGAITPNLAVVQVGAGGKISIYNNSGSVDVLADVSGWFDRDGSGDRFVGLTPARILDTREPGFSAIGSASTVGLQVAGVGGVPADATAVALNVTVTGSNAPSHLTVWPNGVSKPLTSNLNFSTGQTVPNMVVTKLGTGGKISIFNNLGTVHVIVDVVGYFGAGVAPGQGVGVVPFRRLDTRIGLGGPATAFLPGESRDLLVAGAGSVPPTAKAVVLNVTVTGPTATSHLTVWPAGQALPASSNLNFAAGQTVANLVMVKVGADGKISIRNNSGFVHVIADVVAWYG